jgi:predicted nucleic acid-binding protein
MKKDKVFLDSDVILDLLTQREPHYQPSLNLFLMIQEKKILGYTSPVVIANIFYILNRQLNRDKAISSLIKIKALITILRCGDSEIELALLSDFKDFEDAIQYHTALAHEMDIILTRNVKDYKTANINVCTPIEYISTNT